MYNKRKLEHQFRLFKAAEKANIIAICFYFYLIMIHIVEIGRTYVILWYIESLLVFAMTIYYILLKNPKTAGTYCILHLMCLLNVIMYSLVL